MVGFLKMRNTQSSRKFASGRTILSYVIVLSFFGVILGIGHAMHTDTEISGEWKEILLLMLGALIGAFGKVVDHWFKGYETQSETTGVKKEYEE